MRIARREKQAGAAELCHAGLKRHARARRGLLENHRHGLAGERGNAFTALTQAF
jgi:hypothetical protein